MSTTNTSKTFVIHGNFAHTPSFGKLEILKDSYIGIKDGIIEFVEQNKDIISSNYNIPQKDILEYYDKNNPTFFVPGFIDLHVHSAQYAFCGTGTDIPLMKWLNKYTYPSEYKTINNKSYTTHLYKKLIQRLISNGTTTTLYFGTIDVDACIILANIVKHYGVRGFIGKVCQDQYSPHNYCENTAKSISETERFIQEIFALKSDLIYPVITPRFIPNCSTKLLKGLGELYEKYRNENIYIQSHITESLDEVEFVNKLYDKNMTDSMIFDKYKLLNNKCIMVHAVHCNDKDWKILKNKGVGICHCPLSNAFFAHGDLDVIDLIRKYDINIGLGTDIAGGYSYSMLNCMRQCVITNRMIHKHDTENYIDYKHALYLATVGGAKCLNMDNKIGMFKVGMEFDAVLLGNNGNIDVFDHDDVNTMFEKLMNLSDDRNIKGVWVKGNKVNHKDSYSILSKL